MFLLSYLNGVKYEKRFVRLFWENIISFKIYVWSRNPKTAIDLQSDYSAELNNIEILKDLNDHRLLESDVICTCTASEQPLIGLKQVKQGVHINGNSI